MAISSRLELRQGQSLVMTPQLQQAIKLLQLSNMELMEFVEEELERNPLLEHSEGEDQAERRSGDAGEKQEDGIRNESGDAARSDEEKLDLTTDQVQRDTESVFDTDAENVFPESAEPAPPGLHPRNAPAGGCARDPRSGGPGLHHS